MQTKICNRCFIEKDINEFPSTIRRGAIAYCRTCKKEYDREWHAKNKDRLTVIKRKQRANIRNRNQKYITEYLLNHPCIDCGEKDIIVLEFDHRENKVSNVSELIHLSLSILIKEINKCDVRCANCHRRKTAKEFNWYKVQVLPP